MPKLKRRFTKLYLAALLHSSAWFARRPRLNKLTQGYMHGLARLRIKTSQIKPQTELSALGKAWQQAFPSAKHHPITDVDDKTVYGEIHTHCPLRGTGDTQACYRMMEYDRTIAKQAGGEFVVLQSQAEPGVTVCKVAMRFQGADTSDLIPAHKRHLPMA